MKITIEIAKDVKAWDNYKAITSKSFITKVVKNVLNRFPCFELTKAFEVSILLTNNDEMQRLNHEFRGKERPTNVLSFPDIDLNYQHLLEFKPDINYMYLGDIAFGYEVIYNEAINQNKTFNNHFTHLLVHSILHLIGFDHLNEADEQVMEELEIKILKDFAIDSPY